MSNETATTEPARAHDIARILNKASRALTAAQERHVFLSATDAIEEAIRKVKGEDEETVILCYRLLAEHTTVPGKHNFRKYDKERLRLHLDRWEAEETDEIIDVTDALYDLIEVCQEEEGKKKASGVS